MSRKPGRVRARCGALLLSFALAPAGLAAPRGGPPGPMVTLIPAPRCVTSAMLDIRVELSGAASPVVGGQFFLRYDPAVLAFDSVQAGNAPFTVLIFQSADPVAGTVDLAVGVPGGGPGATGGVMAVVRLAVLDQGCGLTDIVHFRAHTPPTRLTNSSGAAIAPALVATGRMIIDGAPLHACRVDLDVSGRIEPVDVALFINKWLTSLNTSTLDGDFDGSGAVDPVDVAVFVNAWFAAIQGGC